MSTGLKILKMGVALLYSISLLYGCNTPEERAKEIEAKVEAAIKSHAIVIQQMKFIPADLTVNKGDTITWINRDIVDHNITEEIKKEWSSGKLTMGKSWSMVAVKSASYYCTIHPVMKGSLIVR